MAIYFMQLKIDGAQIKGESADDQHKEWIELISLSNSIIQPISTAASQGGAKPEGRSQHGDYTFKKRALDVSSPKIALACSMGKRVDEAVIELCRNTGTNDPVCYLKITLKNGFISKWSVDGNEEVPSDVFSINYSEIEWEFKQLNPTDFSQKTTVGHKWNVSANKGD